MISGPEFITYLLVSFLIYSSGMLILTEYLIGIKEMCKDLKNTLKPFTTQNSEDK